MKKILCCIFLCCIYFGASAQTPLYQYSYNFAKYEMFYWKIRGRLIGDDNNKDVYNGFMTVGSGAGMSIPSEKRHPIDRRDFWMYDPQYSDPNTRQQKITILEQQK